MARVSRLRRRLLREMVAENLAVLDEAGPARPRGAPWWALALLAAGVGVAAGVALIPQVGRDGVAPAGTPLFAGPVPGQAANARASLASATGPAFPDPRPVDRAALPLPVRRVVIDPGHGGEHEGTVAPPAGAEKELTLDIARRLRDLLEAGSFQVLLTREEDVTLDLEERARRANAYRGDIFVSIHVNWIPDRESRGVETYFLGPTDDPFLNRLARRENRESGYSLGDLKELVEGIYADVRQDESRRLAEAVQGALYGSLRGASSEVRDWGVKSAPFVVLVATDMPAILAEVSCLSNREEARLLASPAHRQAIAAALAEGIRGYARERTDRG